MLLVLSFIGCEQGKDTGTSDTSADTSDDTSADTSDDISADASDDTSADEVYRGTKIGIMCSPLGWG